MARKKCKTCKGEGRLHLDPCPFGPSSTVLASECECTCGHPAGRICDECEGGGERGRHLKKLSDQVCDDIAAEEDRKFVEYVEEHTLATHIVKQCTGEGNEEGRPEVTRIGAEPPVQELVINYTMPARLNQIEIDLVVEADTCVALKCAECGEDVKDCDCEVDCPECEGAGSIETFEDCWSYSRDCHYTKDYSVECEACGGSGKVLKHDDEEA